MNSMVDRTVRTLMRAVGVMAISAMALPTFAQGSHTGFPSKSIRLIVPATAAGPSDIIARALAQEWSTSLGQPVVVENKPGASGAIAYDTVIKARPDGYTLVLAGTSAMAIYESLASKPPYDTMRDFSFIGNIGAAPSLLVVAPSLPVTNLKELIALAKAKPTQLSFASPTPGSANHLAAEMLKARAGVDVLHVPYKGAAPAELDLMSGRVTFMFHTLPASLPRVKSGQLKALAVSSSQRVSSAPDVPTVAESGFPDFVVTTGFGVLGPLGMPKEVIDRLNDETNKALMRPSFRDRLLSLGIQPSAGSPSDYFETYRTEKHRWQSFVRESNVRVDLN